MRKRRRTRGTWFPTIGTNIPPDDEENIAGREFQINMPIDGTQSTLITQLTFDEPRGSDDDVAADTSLADILGSEYVLQRIVGKLYVNRAVQLTLTGAATSFADGREADNQPAVLLGAGFFVARANDPSSGGGVNTPIGSASNDERRDNYGPLEADTIREPWIWRRTWILGALGSRPKNPGVFTDVGYSGATQSATVAYPPSSCAYGSVADGPHIDSRVKRRVRQDERLWFAVSACTFPAGTPCESGFLAVQGYLDYRIFGSLRKARNSSAF